ncbi:MAG: Lrp/AsnC family transcriptional regulator [Nanoarchaeota archaeon]|nr:Lrp/AsnC family transcriptional regulator [Nanoarchaeota archaeon]
MNKLKLDNKDKLIIQALEEDGRALIKDISKKTKIPRDSVNYRIKKLRSEGVIKGFSPICDTNNMGHPIYTWVNLQLQGFDNDIENKFKSFLKFHPNIIYIAKVTGQYHYIFTVATRTINEFDEVLRTILSQFPNLIKTYNTSLMIEEVQYDTFYRLIK